VVFQAFPHTLGVDQATWRILDIAHQRRNLAEYEGRVDVDAQLLKELISAAAAVLKAVSTLGPVPGRT
jgi:hypothetical protein